MKKFRNIVSIFFGLCALASFIIGVYFCLQPIWWKVEPIVVQMPQFQGRVLSKNQVQPGTFTIEKPFEETSHWGKEAILIYGQNISSIYFEAWRPDQTTPGVFEHARMEHKVNWPFVYQVNNIEIEKGQIMVFPTATGYLAVISICTLIILFSLILAVVTWAQSDN